MSSFSRYAASSRPNGPRDTPRESLAGGKMNKQNAILAPDITDGDSGTRDLNLPSPLQKNPWA